jgi:hypothetical protein
MKRLLTIPTIISSAIILVTTLTGCVIPTYIGNSTLDETETSKSTVKYCSVLVVGAGSTASRVFLENLSTEMMKLFAQYIYKANLSIWGKFQDVHM